MREPTTADLVRDLIDALNKASGAAGQLIHTHGHPGFIAIREFLEKVKDTLTSQAMNEYGKYNKIRLA